ncbi:PKD domain-containing protein [Dactylosporangium sp. NPDC000244]|uniref:YVTN family beta-propeller repeat protein n=1 Tax=Dactylosporangium sp. NPDC000244 TaxID=3154365 RepID=UPI003332EB9C
MRTRIVAGLTTTFVAAGLVLLSGVHPAVAATPLELLYIAASNGPTTFVVDPALGKRVNEAEAGSASGEVAVAPDAGLALIVDSDHNEVVVLSPNRGTIQRRIPVGTAPRGVAIAADRRHAYVTNHGANTLSVIDLTTLTVVATALVGRGPEDVAVTPDGRRLYVTTADGVDVLDAATNTLTRVVTAGQNPAGVAITPDGRYAYVANRGGNTVSVINTATNAVATVAAGRGPLYVATTPDGARAYVTNATDRTVSVIDTTTNAVAATIPLGFAPVAVVVTPDGKRAYVSGTDGTVAKIDTATDTVASSFVGWGGGFGIGLAVGTVEPVAPVASFTVKPVVELGGFNSDTSASLPGTGGFGKYTWDFGDGIVETVYGPNSGHSYQRGGTYTVTLTITDNYGATSTTSRQVSAFPKIKPISLLASNMRYVTAENGGNQPLVANRPGVGGTWERFDLVDVGGDVGLRSLANGKFVTVDPGTGRLTANGTVADAFELVTIDHGAFALRSRRTGKYLSSNDGAAPLTADRAALGPWERFYQLANYQNSANTVLRAAVNNRYVTTDPHGPQPLIANRNAIGSWETFDVIDAGDGWLALFSHANFRFVAAEAGGNQPLIANRTVVGDWERFKLDRLPFWYNVASESLLAGANGKYVTAEAGGNQPLIANRTAMGDWEQFWLMF